MQAVMAPDAEIMPPESLPGVVFVCFQAQWRLYVSSSREPPLDAKPQPAPFLFQQHSSSSDEDDKPRHRRRKRRRREPPRRRKTAKPKLQTIDNCAPAPWAHVRYFIERQLDLHSLRERRNSSFIKGYVVTDFEQLVIRPLTIDTEYIANETVIVLSRHPLPTDMPHFVPEALTKHFRFWFEQEKRKLGDKRLGKVLRVRRDERGFATASVRFRNHGRVRMLGAPNMHASCMPNAKTAPPWYACKRCGKRGVHWDVYCQESEDIVPMRSKRAIHGIPRFELVELDPASGEGRRAPYKDLEGRVYMRRSMRAQAVDFLNTIKV